MTTLSVPEMTCGHCKTSVEKQLSTLADAGEIAVDLPARKVAVSGPAPADQLVKALAEIGFSATILTAN